MNVSPRTKLEELVGKKTYEKIKPAYQKSALKGWQEICEVLANQTVLIERGRYCNNLLFELCGDRKSKDCFRPGVDYHYPEAIYEKSSLKSIEPYLSNDKWVKPNQSFKPFLLGVYHREIYLVIVENDVLRVGNLTSSKWEWTEGNEMYTFGFNANSQRGGEDLSLGGWYSEKSLLFPRYGTICTFNFPLGGDL